MGHANMPTWQYGRMPHDGRMAVDGPHGPREGEDAGMMELRPAFHLVASRPVLPYHGAHCPPVTASEHARIDGHRRSGM